MKNFTAGVTNHMQGKRVTLETFNITVIKTDSVQSSSKKIFTKNLLTAR